MSVTPRELFLTLAGLLMAMCSAIEVSADESGSSTPKGSSPPRDPISNPMVETAIRKSMKKSTGKLTQKDLNEVTRLVLANSKITDQGLKQVSSLPNLSSLALAFCTEITDAGLKPLLQCKQLTTLSLISTNITDVA